MRVTQNLGFLCDREVSVLKHVTVETFQERADRCERGSSTYALLKEEKHLPPVFPIFVPKSGGHYIPSFSIEAAV